MKSFVIDKNDAGQRLDKFITKSCPMLPTSLMYKAIRTKNIKLNRKRCEISTKLSVGDVVDIYLKDEFFEKPAEMIGIGEPAFFGDVADFQYSVCQ